MKAREWIPNCRDVVTIRIDRKNYKKAEPDAWLEFTRPWQYRIEPEFAGRLAYLASVEGGEILITYGFRSREEQVEAAMNSLAANPEYYMGSNGVVYNPAGQAMVAAPGRSSHNYGFAVDSPGTWLEEMPNEAIAPYGLFKPMSYEPWHIQMIETKGVSIPEKRAEFHQYMGGGYYPMDIMTFQMITGLKPDNIPGAKTQAKAKEILPLLHMILGTDYTTPEETIMATQNGPDLWLPRLNEIKYFDAFIMNIVNRMKGLR